MGGKKLLLGSARCAAKILPISMFLRNECACLAGTTVSTGLRSRARTVDRLVGDFGTALPVKLNLKVLGDGRYSTILQQGLELGGVHGLAKKMMELDSGLALPRGLFFKTGQGDKYRGLQAFELF